MNISLEESFVFILTISIVVVSILFILTWTGIVPTKGVQGKSGVRGFKGDTGLTGPVGPVGPDGQDGKIGLTGLSGPVGAIGPSGPQGEVGKDGLTGLIGLTGLSGPVGAIGPPGPPGEAGKEGLIGLTGATGPAAVLSKLQGTITLMNSFVSTISTTPFLEFWYSPVNAMVVFRFVSTVALAAKSFIIFANIPNELERGKINDPIVGSVYSYLATGDIMTTPGPMLGVTLRQNGDLQLANVSVAIMAAGTSVYGSIHWNTLA